MKYKEELLDIDWDIIDDFRAMPEDVIQMIITPSLEDKSEKKMFIFGTPSMKMPTTYVKYNGEVVNIDWRDYKDEV